MMEFVSDFGDSTINSGVVTGPAANLPMVNGFLVGELLSWQHLTVSSLCLSLLAVILESVSLSAPYSRFDNTAEVMIFNLYDCPGANGRACDSPTASNLVQTALAVGILLCLPLTLLCAQAFMQWASGGSPASTGWARTFFRPTGCCVAILHLSLIASALGVKESALRSVSGFTTKSAGWSCLVVTLITTTIQLVPLILLATDDVYVSAAVRAAAAAEISKVIRNNSPLAAAKTRPVSASAAASAAPSPHGGTASSLTATFSQQQAGPFLSPSQHFSARSPRAQAITHNNPNTLVDARLNGGGGHATAAAIARLDAYRSVAVASPRVPGGVLPPMGLLGRKSNY